MGRHSLLSKGNMGDIVRFLTKCTLEAVDELSKSQAEAGVIGRLVMNGDFEDDGQGGIRFSGKAKTIVPEEIPMAVSLDGGYTAKHSREGEGSVEIFFQIAAQIKPR